MQIEKRALRETKAAEYTGRSVYWMRDARIGRTKIKGPPYVKIGRSVYYYIEDLDDWLNQFKQAS